MSGRTRSSGSGVCVSLAAEHRLRRAAGERGLSGQHLVAHDAHSVQIGGGPDVHLAGGLLGCHVGRRADRQPEGGERPAGVRDGPRRGRRLGDTEVHHQRVPAREHHVFGFDVPVHDAEAVGVGQRVENVLEITHRLGSLQPPLPLQPPPQRLSFDVRHDVVERARAPRVR